MTLSPLYSDEVVCGWQRGSAGLGDLTDAKAGQIGIPLAHAYSTPTDACLLLYDSKQSGLRTNTSNYCTMNRSVAPPGTGSQHRVCTDKTLTGDPTRP